LYFWWHRNIIPYYWSNTFVLSCNKRFELSCNNSSFAGGADGLELAELEGLEDIDELIDVDGDDEGDGEEEAELDGELEGEDDSDDEPVCVKQTLIHEEPSQ
jgi:hypothetical protein